MGSTERRERERIGLKQLILDTARDLFLEHGYDAVTMRRIADKIEYTPATIYLHFKDKESLVRELIDADFRKFAEQFAALTQIEDPIKRIEAAAQAYTRFALTYPNHYRLMFMSQTFGSDPQDNPDHGIPERDAYAFLRWTVQQAIESGRFRPEFCDVDLASQVIWAGIHGVVSLEITIGGHCWVDWRPIEERVALMQRIVLSGMLREELVESQAAER
ncbi:MAG TPA: TetR/AcrR family transcriptional regulator [Planctomycetaceae bacterium]|nr:TetR/AcrR family transcriptional regulator [Planctomycetaceae bacterium]